MMLLGASTSYPFRDGKCFEPKKILNGAGRCKKLYTWHWFFIAKILSKIIPNVFLIPCIYIDSLCTWKQTHNHKYINTWDIYDGCLHNMNTNMFPMHSCLRATLNKGPRTKSLRTNLKQIEPWVRIFSH